MNARARRHRPREGSRSISRLALTTLAVALAACGPDAMRSDAALDAAREVGTVDAFADEPQPAPDGAPRSDTTPFGEDAGPTAPDADSSAAPSGIAMRFGINMGYQTSAIDDAESADVSHRAGANSARIKLSEQHLERWGDTIEVADMEHYRAIGMRDLVCFLGGPTAAHSTAPAGTADWQLEQYAPRNLHEPIFLSDGTVNPQNYWAAFVARAVRTYGRFVRTWEVWNEPDQVGGNWMATQQWTTRAPTARELIWWNASIYDYIRMLRVTYEVVHRIDPSARVALGGIGYENFLAALLRYTDEPTAGAVDAQHPRRGGAYFDTVSFHYYPVFAPGNSDVGADGLVTAYEALRRVLAASDAGPKHFIVTETGAPRFAFGTSPGGVEYARNYLVKVMALAHDAGIEGLDWFVLGDGAALGRSMDPFAYMGLYENYAMATAPGDLRITDTGVAYATLGARLGDATSDPAATRALGLAGGARGVALRLAGGRRAYVLWARASMGSERGSATVSLASGPLVLYAWDASRTGASRRLEPGSDGRVQLTLDASPVLLLEP